MQIFIDGVFLDVQFTHNFDELLELMYLSLNMSESLAYANIPIGDRIVFVKSLKKPEQQHPLFYSSYSPEEQEP